MGYRDEGEAAMHRVQNLEAEKDDLQAQNAALRSQLERANAEIVRLHGEPIPPRAPGGHNPLNRILVRVWLGIAALALGPLAMAAYRSETKGVQAAMFVIPLWGGLIGASRWQRRSTPSFLLVGLASAFATFAVLLLFFATLWRAL